MKKLFFFFSLIITISASAQTYPWISIHNYQRHDGLWPSRLLALPSDTVTNKQIGSIAYLDGVTYIKNLFSWDPLALSGTGGGGDGAGPLTLQDVINNGNQFDRSNILRGNGYDFFIDSIDNFTINANNLYVPSLRSGESTNQFITTNGFGGFTLKSIEFPVDTSGFAGTQDLQSTIDYGNRFRHNNTIHAVGHDFYIDSLGNYSTFSGHTATFDNQTGAYTEIHQDSANAYLYSQSHTGLNISEVRTHQDSVHLQAYDSLGNNARFTGYAKGTLNSYASVADSMNSPKIVFGDANYKNTDTTKALATNSVGDMVFKTLYSSNPALPCYGVLQPGYVTGSGSGLTVNVTAAIYRINCVTYNSGAGSVTLSIADATNPRYDVVYVDNTGSIGVITGTASANPSIPQVDPATQIELTSIFVDAGATSLPITDQVIYDENTEAWTGTATGVTANFTNTLNVQHGTKSADVGSWTTGQQLNFTKNSGTITATDYSIETFYIKLKVALASTANVRVSFLNGTTVVSSVVTLGTGQGFTKTSTAQQTIAIPISAFTFTSTTVNKVRITLVGTGGGLYLDYLRLQSGVVTTTTETDPVAINKTVSVHPGYGIIIPETVSQTISSNPSHTPTVDTTKISLKLIPAKDTLGVDVRSYPAGVYNINQLFLGVAYNQNEAATLWNASSADQALGTLSAGNAPFSFFMRSPLTSAPQQITMQPQVAIGQIFYDDFDRGYWGSNYDTTGLSGVTTTFGSSFVQLAYGSNNDDFTKIVKYIGSGHRTLRNFEIEIGFKMDALAANSYGPILGSYSTRNPNQNCTSVFYPHFSTSSSTNIGGANSSGVITNKATSSIAFPTMSTAHNYVAMMKVATDTLKGILIDKNTSELKTIDYVYDFTNTTQTATKPNIFYPAFGVNGITTTSIDYLKFSSTEKRYVKMIFVGNSITTGYYSGKATSAFAEQLKGKTPYDIQILAGGYNRTAEVLDDTAEIKDMHGEYIFVEIGTNDRGTGVSSATIHANLTTIYNTLTSAGSKVYFLLAPDAGNPATGGTDNNWIVTNYSSNYVDTWTGLYGTGTMLPDAIHPNETGERQIADSIAAKMPVLFPVTGKINRDWSSLKSYNTIDNIVLTTTGSSGAATWSSSTGTLNIPQYAGGGVTGWPLSGQGLLSGQDTITSNVPSQLIWNGTYTATANNQFHFKFIPAQTFRATTNDVLIGMQMAPAVTYASTGQNYIALDIAPTFAGTAGQTKTALRTTGDIIPSATTTYDMGKTSAVWSTGWFLTTSTNVFQTVSGSTFSWRGGSGVIASLTTGSDLILNPKPNAGVDANYRVDAFGEIRATGGIVAAQLGAPSFAVTQTGTAGSTSYTYVVQGVLLNGRVTPISTISTATGNATLSGGNGNVIAIAITPGVFQYKIYRSASSGSPATTGLIASASSAAGNITDNGLTASGTVPTNTNDETGDVIVGGTTAKANLTVNGSASFGYVEVSSTYAILSTDYTVNCTSGTFTATLPTAVGCSGRVYVIKNTGAGTITMATTSSQTIDGASPGTVAAGGVLKLQSTGANWISW